MTAIFAHRGASRYAPENTMSAFQKALDLGSDGIELDVQLTKDNIPVVIHDETLKRTTKKKGFVREHTYNQLRDLDAGKWFSKHFKEERIPSLEEVLIWMKPTNLLLNIELKNSILPYYGMEKILTELVGKHHLQDRMIYSSFNHYSLRELQMLNPNVDVAPLYSEGLYEPWNYVLNLNATSVHPHWRTIDASILDHFNQHMIKVRPYTVNDPKRMKWFFDQQVDAIITDRPDVARIVQKNTYPSKSSKLVTIIKKMNPLRKKHT